MALDFPGSAVLNEELQSLHQRGLESFLALPDQEQLACLNALDPVTAGRQEFHLKTDCRYCSTISARWKREHIHGMRHAAAIEGAQEKNVKNLHKTLQTAYFCGGSAQYRATLGLIRAESQRRQLEKAVDRVSPLPSRPRSRL